MDTQKGDPDQRRDALLLRLLKTPPQPRPKRERGKKERGRRPEKRPTPDDAAPNSPSAAR